MGNTILSPGDPDRCKGNGEAVDDNGKPVECCCDECDHFLLCFPEYKKGVNPYGKEDL